jgi:hypothetical protein
MLLKRLFINFIRINQQINQRKNEDGKLYKLRVGLVCHTPCMQATGIVSGPIWEGSGSSKTGSNRDFFKGAASLPEQMSFTNRLERQRDQP